MRTIKHPDFGDVRINTTIRAKRISIKIAPNSPITLTIPHSDFENKAIDFLNSKSEWVKKKLAIQTKLSYGNELIPNLNYRIQSIKTSSPNPRLTVKKGIIEVSIPSNLELNSEKIQALIQKGIDFALKVEAKKHLPLRVAELAEKHNYSYQSLKITSAKTRWGSCSSTNNINLSKSLMLLPKHLIDYIIIHELCHTIHKNHSKSFWLEVAKHQPNYKRHHKELKGYSTRY